MRIYPGLILLVLMLGFVLFPSVRLSSPVASAPSAAASTARQESQSGQVAPAAATFIVNSTADAPDVMPGDGLCQDFTGNCTLRAALMEANAFAGTDTINFDIQPGGPQTLTFTSGLPPITDTVTINGTTQGGFSGTPIIELRGSGVPPPLLAVQGSNCTMTGLVVNTVDGNAIALLGNNNKISGCFIGTDFSGAVPGPGNVGSGVVISGSNNSVGGVAAGDSNVIGFNGRGVSVTAGSGNSILSNGIFQSAVLGIDLNNNGPTPNDACDVDNGPNNLQNFPVITGAQSTGMIISIQGTLNSTAGSSFRIEFFVNSTCHPSTFGEGERFIGSTTVTTNASCNATFNVIFPVEVNPGDLVTATATAGNSTSEFSQCVPVAAAPATNADLQVNKSDSPDPVAAGSNLTYTISFHNNGPDDAQMVTVTDAVPANCTFVSAMVAAGSGWNVNTPLVGGAGNVVFSKPVAPSADAAMFIIVVKVAPNTVNGTVIINDATANSFTNDPIPGNNKATVDTMVVTSADLAISKADAPDPVISGNNITYSINFVNLGPSNAQTVTVTDATPANTTFVSAAVTAGSGWSVNSPAVGGTGNVVFSKAAVSPGETAAFRVVVKVNPGTPGGTTISNSVVAGTATSDPAASNNTAIANTMVASCTLTCPANITRTNDSNQCGAVVTYPDPIPSGGCGEITCSPDSGSFFPVGATVVVCAAAGGPPCQFLVRVIDNTAPKLTCPGNFVIQLLPGQTSARVNFPDPEVTDNCGASVACTPPSGSIFPAGTTFVTCFGFDQSTNSASCIFGVTLVDAEAPVVRCPSNVVVEVPSNQCSAVATYPAPTVTDNTPGATVVCSPPSGSTFSVGVTTVTCTATDVAGNRSACTFNVTLIGGVTQAVVSPASVNIKAVNVFSSKNKKRVKTGEFSILNNGCGPLRLVFRSIRRVTDQSKFSNTDDSAFFSVFSRGPDGSPTGPNLLGQQVTIDQGSANQRAFVVRFAPSIPVVTGKTSGLSAVDVLPNSFQSVLSFDGTDRTVTINAAVRTGVALIDPVNPQNPAVATLCRSGNQFIVNYWLYDSDKSDVKTARYEFLDNSGNVIAAIDNVDLAGPIGQSGIVNGQSFNIENAFTGANDNSSVTKVRVIVFGGNSSDTVTSNTLQSSCGTGIQSFMQQQVTLLLPVLRLDAGKP